MSLKEDKLRFKNLNDLLNRSDYKKSKVYQSSYVGPTAPSYNAAAGAIVYEKPDLIACLCEGSMEHTIMEILLENNRLIFEREQC